MQILVTGGTGFIGSHTVVELFNAGYEPIIVDNLSNSSIEVLAGIEQIIGQKPLFYQVDCKDMDQMDAIFKANPGIQAIIHFAASKYVGESVSMPLLYYRNNLRSMLNILELMTNNNVPNLVFSSSCTVYGQPDILPVTEEAPIKVALSPYGNTKQICEEIIQDALKADKNLNSIILRYFNPIGSHPTAIIGETPNGVPQNLIPFLTQTAAGIREELKVFGGDYDTPDGTCIRDYINVCDLAKAHVAAVKRLTEQTMTDNVETYNIGTGHGETVLNLINTFEKATGVKVKYSIVGRREGDIEKVWAEASKAKEYLGWEAEKTLEETLLSAWNWQKKISNL